MFSHSFLIFSDFQVLQGHKQFFQLILIFQVDFEYSVENIGETKDQTGDGTAASAVIVQGLITGP